MIALNHASFSPLHGLERKFFASARPTASRLVAVAVATLWGCSASPDSQPPLGGPEPTAAGAGGSASGGTVAPVNPLGRPRCQPPQGTTGSPRTIEEAVALLNALPKPTSVACFVESLDRPLDIYATNSIFSAQPALSTSSPRVFIKRDRLWLSVVIDGASSYLVEFGHITDDPEPRSLKGELKLPLVDVVQPNDPYDQVRFGEGTACGLCHTDERRDASIDFATAFTSTAYRPRPETRVAVDALRLQDQQCNWQTEPHRCEMLSSLFQGGLVTEVSFPDTMSTFF